MTRCARRTFPPREGPINREERTERRMQELPEISSVVPLASASIIWQTWAAARHDRPNCRSFQVGYCGQDTVKSPHSHRAPIGRARRVSPP
jgi:hypothetical protein